jgi:hypothetical protein
VRFTRDRRGARRRQYCLDATLKTTNRLPSKTSEMVARLTGKKAGGRDQEVHRLLPQVKKEIRLEQKESKVLTISRLDQK